MENLELSRHIGLKNPARLRFGNGLHLATEESDSNIYYAYSENENEAFPGNETF
jgi:hypothetical protein